MQVLASIIIIYFYKPELSESQYACTHWGFVYSGILSCPSAVQSTWPHWLSRGLMGGPSCHLVSHVPSCALVSTKGCTRPGGPQNYYATLFVQSQWDALLGWQSSFSHCWLRIYNLFLETTITLCPNSTLIMSMFDSVSIPNTSGHFLTETEYELKVHYVVYSDDCTCGDWYLDVGHSVSL